MGNLFSFEVKHLLFKFFETFSPGHPLVQLVFKFVAQAAQLGYGVILLSCQCLCSVMFAFLDVEALTVNGKCEGHSCRTNFNYYPIKVTLA